MQYGDTHTNTRSWQHWIRLIAVSLILLVWWQPLPALALPAGNAITDGRTILRQALPITEPKIRVLDETLSRIDQDLKYNRWSVTRADVKAAQQVVGQQAPSLIAQLPVPQQTIAQTQVQQIQQHLLSLQEQLNRKSKGKEDARLAYDEVLTSLEAFEQNWLGDFPYELPASYADLPRLLGRAEVELVTTAGTMYLTLDGYSAPLTAGNFADLVQKGFYDGLGFDRVEDFYVIQAGDPPGPADGYVDPTLHETRTIPLEIRAKGELKPRYGKTFEEWGIWDAEPALPFSVEGTVAMARYPDDNNSASSQFFIFLAEPDLTPAGLNLMDGRYAAFGYVTQGQEVMVKIKKEDHIVSARLIAGSEHLQAGSLQPVA
ncbi:MAG: peptidylprolyl isomerase [Cyanobacteriota bacterium]|nr:peptidylprolyl isomerase [Cyanobacteriota bacterium]